MSSPAGRARAERRNSIGSIPNVYSSTMYSDSPPSPDEIEYIPVFYQEVSDIMRGYGDCAEPLRESVILVEQIIIQQVSSILNDAINCAIERCGQPTPAQCDFERLMWRRPKRISRLRKHLGDLELRRRYLAMLRGQQCPRTAEDAAVSDPPLELVREGHDEERVRRLFRADRISVGLTGEEYLKYNESRRTSFYCRNSTLIRTKLKTLLDPPEDANISMRVYNILGWLVHETIAVVVDFAILTRLNSGNRKVKQNVKMSSGIKMLSVTFVPCSMAN